MSLPNIAYLVLVVAGFSSFFVALFWGWVFVNWSEWFPVPTASRRPRRREATAPYQRRETV
jgi:hypothetical protein